MDLKVTGRRTAGSHQYNHFAYDELRHLDLIIACVGSGPVDS